MVNIVFILLRFGPMELFQTSLNYIRSNENVNRSYKYDIRHSHGTHSTFDIDQEINWQYFCVVRAIPFISFNQYKFTIGDTVTYYSRSELEFSRTVWMKCSSLFKR